jgi:hypothetical protein
MTVIEIRPFRNGWQVYESAGVQPVFLDQEQAIDYAKNRACFRSCEIRVLDSTDTVERTIAFSEGEERWRKICSTFARVLILCGCAKSVRRLQQSHLTLFPPRTTGSLAQLEVMAMRITESFWSSLFHREIKKIIPSHLGLRAPAHILANFL